MRDTFREEVAQYQRMLDVVGEITSVLADRVETVDAPLITKVQMHSKAVEGVRKRTRTDIRSTLRVYKRGEEE